VGLWAQAARDAGAVVFLAVHGAGGEDGGLQAGLAELGVPHTGPPAAAAALAWDKARPAAPCCALGDVSGVAPGAPVARWAVCVAPPWGPHCTLGDVSGIAPGSPTAHWVV
jgi:hypothetical protein